MIAPNSNRTPVVVLADPLGAGLTSDALYTCWYNRPWLMAYAGARTKRDMARLLATYGVDYVIVDARFQPETASGPPGIGHGQGRGAGTDQHPAGPPATAVRGVTRDGRIAVVIPSYRVTRHILGVLGAVGPDVWRIYVIDDGCPDGSGRHVEENCRDPRVVVLRHESNQGVGGAVITGYLAAIADGADVIVKVDADGQMDPALIPEIAGPILAGEADYAKGNRFVDLEAIRSMPRKRILGNAILSLMTKLSSGYWDLFDPTNGYTAIHADVARHLPFAKISRRYFFESDMLFRLNTLRAVVVDVPMEATYKDEVTNLRIESVVVEFIFKHVRNFLKRIFYNYWLRDVSIASVELPLGLALFVAGATFGAWHWTMSARAGVATPAGTVMVAGLPVLMGVQLILAFLAYDIASVPRRPKSRRASMEDAGRSSAGEAAVAMLMREPRGLARR